MSLVRRTTCLNFNSSWRKKRGMLFLLTPGRCFKLSSKIYASSPILFRLLFILRDWVTRSKLVFSVKAQNNWECGRVCCQFRCQSPVSGTISVWPAPVPRSQITHYNRQPRGGKGNKIQNPNFCYQTMLSQNNHKVKVCGQFSWFLLFPVNNFS